MCDRSLFRLVVFENTNGKQKSNYKFQNGYSSVSFGKCCLNLHFKKSRFAKLVKHVHAISSEESSVHKVLRNWQFKFINKEHA